MPDPRFTRIVRSPSRVAALLAALVSALLTGCQRGSSTGEGLEEIEPSLAAVVPARRPAAAASPACSHRDPLRDAFFGDLHVHTAASADAYAFETLRGPDAAYDFARGGAIQRSETSGRRPFRLARPLDFAAVTDHAEWFAELPLCIEPSSPLWSSEACRAYRGETSAPVPPKAAHMQRLFDFLRAAQESPTLCDRAPEACATWGSNTWLEMQRAAERWNSPCDFTTFVAYEWSQTSRGINLHRNVIFRNEQVPDVAVSSVTAPTPPELWESLERDCLEAGTGCDVLAIPHNSNLSNGVMFEPSPAADVDARARARLRSRLEPLMEIYQVKGDSECRNGMYGVIGATDELCNFEKTIPLAPASEDCRDETGAGGMSRMGCVSRRNFARYALAEGMRERTRLGVNPFQFGFVAATDTHNATPGAVSESDFPGSLGVTDASIPQRLVDAANRPSDWVGQPVPIRDSPGGLAGVWAEENSREAIFQALRRRETFGTSGPRIRARFFGGFDYPDDLCDADDWVAEGYAGGVAMGGTLPTPSRSAAAPVFVAAATRDPGLPGQPGNGLERIQIVKVWAGQDGAVHQRIFDIAGEDRSAGVDPATCQPLGTGADALCGVWRDPDFDAEHDASYYARVLEVPSCRWSALQCLELPSGSRPETCTNDTVPRTIRERAWTSPIWYVPPASSSFRTGVEVDRD